MDKYDIMRLIAKVCESIAAVSCIILLPRWRKSEWKLIPFYVLFVAVSEWTGYYLRIHPVSFLQNPDYYSFIVHPVIFFFIYTFLYSIDDKKNIGLLLGISVLYVISCIVDSVFFRMQSFWFMSFSYMIGVVLLLTLLIRFYLRFFFSDRILHFRSSASFWICTAWFIYYAGTFPFFALRNTLAQNYYNVFVIYWFVQMIASCLMYISIIFIFKWAKQR